MRVRAGGSRAMRHGGATQLVLLIAAAWVAGLAIVLVFTIEQPTRPSVHAGVSTTPSSEAVQGTAGRRWTIGADVQVTAGRRWTGSPVDGQTAGRRWTGSPAGGTV